MARVFVSYRRVAPDDGVAMALYHRLSDRGHDVFLDSEGVHLGDHWPRKIRDALERAEWFVALVSLAYLNSTHCVDEELVIAALRLAVGSLTGLLPVRLAFDGKFPASVHDVLTNTQAFLWRDKADTEAMIDAIIARLPPPTTLFAGAVHGLVKEEEPREREEQPREREEDPSPVAVPHAPVLVALAPALGTHKFVGRTRELAEIEALFTGASDVPIRAALHGLPGIGKTELARQVVARLELSKRFPGGIFWFNAEHVDLRMQWAERVEDPGHVLPDLGQRAGWAIRQVKERAQRGEAVLIVLDNVETWEPKEQRPGPLPDASAIWLLVTTHRRRLDNSFDMHEVTPLAVESARNLLGEFVGPEVGGAEKLLAALGGHVLSIELAATYLREYGVPPDEYLRQLEAGKDPSSSVVTQTSYGATAESAFRLLWKRVEPDVRYAWILAAQLPPVWFSNELAEAIGLDVEHRTALVRLHVLDRDNQGQCQMYRLLRTFALTEQPPSESVRTSVIRGATQLLETGDEEMTFQRYRRDAGSFTHLVATSANTPTDARFRAVCGDTLRRLGELSAARRLLEQALASDLQTYGEDHPQVATGRNNLALVVQDLGELSAARRLFEQALASDLETHGEDHPQVSTGRNNLAWVLRELGELSAARRLFEQALASDLETHGEDHPSVARDRNNLALVLQDLGDFAGARRLFEQALAFDLETYGEDHPSVARDRNNLALVLRDLGEPSAARQLLEQALASDGKVYGQDHPSVARDRNNLALVLRDLGKPSAARALLEQALASDVEVYGEDHPSVARDRNNLALVLQDLDEPAAARPLFEQALAWFLEAYGNDHPQVATGRSNLALVLRDLGELAAARRLLEQALASDLKACGENHPSVARDRNNLARLLEDLGELAAARQLFEQALASALKAYGEDHPSVATVRHNLARVRPSPVELFWDAYSKWRSRRRN